MTREEHDKIFNDHQLEVGNEPNTQAQLDKLWDERLEYVRITGHDMTSEELIGVFGNYGDAFRRYVGEKIRDKAKKWIRKNDIGPTEAKGLMNHCEDMIFDKGFL